MRCAAPECRRSFRLTSGLERRWSGGLAGRALTGAQRRRIANRRRRWLNTAVGHARFGCQQRRPRRIDILPDGRRRQRRTEVRRRANPVGAVMPAHRHARASIRGAPQEQHERRRKKAYQGTSRGRRHVSDCALTDCSNVRVSAPAIKRQRTPLQQPFYPARSRHPSTPRSRGAIFTNSEPSERAANDDLVA